MREETTTVGIKNTSIELNNTWGRLKTKKVLLTFTWINSKLRQVYLSRSKYL